jgi:hypothetical protein
MRQYQLDKCFQDGQIPCRWVPDMGYGYGYPLFNYYPPLPYLLGHAFRMLGLAYIDIVKVVGVTGFVLTAFFMYLLGKEFWGRLGGIVASLFYTYAPYHSVDFYVRGAINEFWAMCFYPAIFWSTYKLISTNKSSYVPVVSLTVAGLMLSHNPMLMIFTPFYIVWIIYWWWKFKSLRSFKYLFISAFISLGLSAFFTLPVLFEQKFVSVWTLTSGYFNYLAHFLDLKQIFLDINWGYGSSELGPHDTMSFAIGYLHWIVPALLLLTSIVSKKLSPFRSLIWLFVLVVLGSLFMTHSKSTFIWMKFKPLEFLQFPWRFLTLSVFAASFVSGSIAKLLNPKLVALVLFTLILLNGSYFRPREWYSNMTDELKFSGKSWQLLVTSGIFDYLPIWAPQPPADPAGSNINITQGAGEYQTLQKTSNKQKYSLNISSTKAVAELQTYYFPGWIVKLDGKKELVDPSRDKLLGRIQVDVPMGIHTLEAEFTNTPIRSFSNILSFLTWIGMGVYLTFIVTRFALLRVREH